MICHLIYVSYAPARTYGICPISQSAEDLTPCSIQIGQYLPQTSRTSSACTGNNCLKGMPTLRKRLWLRICCFFSRSITCLYAWSLLTHTDCTKFTYTCRCGLTKSRIVTVGYTHILFTLVLQIISQNSAAGFYCRVHGRVSLRDKVQNCN